MYKPAATFILLFSPSTCFPYICPARNVLCMYKSSYPADHYTGCIDSQNCTKKCVYAWVWIDWLVLYCMGMVPACVCVCVCVCVVLCCAGCVFVCVWFTACLYVYQWVQNMGWGQLCAIAACPAAIRVWSHNLHLSSLLSTAFPVFIHPPSPLQAVWAWARNSSSPPPLPPSSPPPPLPHRCNVLTRWLSLTFFPAKIIR